MAEVSFGEWLKRRRGAQGWTQKQLAQHINCSLSALRKMEAEERRPSPQVVEQLAELFNIPQNERKAFLRFARGDWGAISSPGGETDEAPWRVSGVAPRSNLPASLTSFIGREKEQAEIINLIAKNRLVTLTGIGGIGKTRLSLQVGGKLLNDFSNGVWFIALDSLFNPALVPQAVAAMFDIRDTPDRSVVEILINVLREKTTLLILDNCEHLSDACAQLIKTLLTNCPNIKILATSREVLNVEGESMYHLASLSIPEDHDLLLENLPDHDSIQLFNERARLALSSFILTKENAKPVIDICRKVDGIPLAIELAAARVNILQVEEINKQLQDSFALLTNKGRTTLPRHQTLQASMDWSWGLLSEAEQIFLRQLSVFAGGWTLESAQAIFDEDVLDLTSALVKKSLIMVDRKSEGWTRYHFHEIVRQYIRERLRESGEEEDIQTRHLQYFLQLSEQAEPALRGPTQVEWMSRLNEERDNIRAALEWADETDVEAGLYMSGRLGDFWENFDMRQGTRWLEKFVRKPESRSRPRARANALLTLGWLASGLDLNDEARSYGEECLKLCRASDDKSGEVDALLLLSNLVHRSEAGEFHQQALALTRSLNDTWRTAQALYYSGWARTDHLSYIKEALTLFQKVGDLRHMAVSMAELGRIELLNNDLEAAQNYLDEAVSLARELNIKNMMSDILQGYGRIAARKGEYEQAYVYLHEGAMIDQEYGYQVNYLFACSHLGYLALYQGETTKAREIFSETGREFFKNSNEIGVVFNLEGMAGVLVAFDKPEIAVKLIGASDSTREIIGDPRFPFEQVDVDKIIATCLEKMSEAAFSAAYDAGKKMSLEEAVELALSED